MRARCPKCGSSIFVMPDGSATIAAAKTAPIAMPDDLPSPAAAALPSAKGALFSLDDLPAPAAGDSMLLPALKPGSDLDDPFGAALPAPASVSPSPLGAGLPSPVGAGLPSPVGAGLLQAPRFRRVCRTSRAPRCLPPFARVFHRSAAQDCHRWAARDCPRWGAHFPRDRRLVAFGRHHSSNRRLVAFGGGLAPVRGRIVANAVWSAKTGARSRSTSTSTGRPPRPRTSRRASGLGRCRCPLLRPSPILAGG